MPRERRVALPDEDATVGWGRRLGALLRAGDLLVLTGGLGAGKTTLTRGVAEGLGVRGPVTSPTFVLSREHPSLVGGPALVHVDAYRLTELGPADADAQLDALDLDASLADSVTVVEWGAGLVQGLAADYLEVTLGGAPVDALDDAPSATPGGEARVATLVPHGPRWTGVDAARTLDGLAGRG